MATTYPQAAGYAALGNLKTISSTLQTSFSFPFFTWAQLFFTAVDQEIVGFFKVCVSDPIVLYMDPI
jgi:hypothetical protein